MQSSNLILLRKQDLYFLSLKQSSCMFLLMILSRSAVSNPGVSILQTCVRMCAASQGMISPGKNFQLSPISDIGWMDSKNPLLRSIIEFGNGQTKHFHQTRTELRFSFSKRRKAFRYMQPVIIFEMMS